jgi:hypothetical protein
VINGIWGIADSVAVYVHSCVVAPIVSARRIPIIPRIHRVLDGDVLKVVDEVIMVNPVVGVIIVLIGLSTTDSILVV